MPEKEVVPDDLRCNRSDGRQWRCKRRALEGKKMCEIHHMQFSLRQHKQKVPESLKLIRSKKVGESSETELNGGIRAHRSGKLGKKSKRKREIDEAEAVDEAVRKMKLKRGDAQLDLIRMVLKREVEKMKKPNTKKKKKTENNREFDGSEGEVTRILPFGVMAISSYLPNTDNAASPCDVKVGMESITASRRRFRSKNIEPLSIGKMQAVPFKGILVNARKEKNKKCHWCGSKKLENLICCLSCRRQFFCLDCIQKRKAESREEIERDCPVCRGSCRCRPCSVSMSQITECKDLTSNGSEIDRILHLHYLLCMLLPVLKHLNAEHKAEMQREAETRDVKHRGKYPCEEHSHTDGSPDLDVEFSDTDKELTVTNKLEISVEEIVSCYELPEVLDKPSGCSICLGTGDRSEKVEYLKEASRRREDPSGNFLYCPTMNDFNHNNNLEHFQMHWNQGHPVIVRNVVKGSSDLNWDPLTLFCVYLQNSDNQSHNNEADADCLDWFEVDIGTKQFFSGSLRGKAETNTFQEKLKLEGRVSPRLFEEQFPAHYAEVLDILPIPHYMDPHLGILNIAAKLPDEIKFPDLGPCLNIYYTSGDEFRQQDSVKKLGFEFCDKIDILLHVTEASVSTKQFCRIRKLMKRKGDLEASQTVSDELNYDLENEDKEIEVSSYGAQWDVFCRQDVPKLVEYLEKHSHELERIDSGRNHASHPLLGQSYYLDAHHKARLKEEFEIEPWTFNQHIGEAVIIPAGCPFQTRKVKSCVNVILNFLSPEHVTESIQRMEELRHESKIEIKKMAIHKINEAVKEIRRLTSSSSTPSLK